MTAPELNYYFQEKFSEHRGIDPLPTYTVEYYLTQAQKDILRDLLRSGYDRDEYNRRMLQPLVRNFNLTPASITTTPTYTDSKLAVEIFNFGEQIRHILNDVVDVTFNSNSIYDGMSVTLSTIKPIREDYFNANKDNPHKKPTAFELWRLEDYNTEVTNAVVIVGTSDYDIDRYKGRYIKNPADIKILDTQQTAELHEDLHEDIVELAVRLAVSSFATKE